MGPLDKVAVNMEGVTAMIPDLETIECHVQVTL
jgi:hypothetical protein